MDSMTTALHIGGTGEGRETTRMSVDMLPNKKCFRLEDQFEQLFPRLPNEITFCRIVPKLPWRAFHILAAVSRAWRKAIQTHRVYDARIHSSSTDTLVVHSHNYIRTERIISRIAVYSTKDKLCYDLPPIPGHSRGIPSSCECVSIDGKIYVLGGAVEGHNPANSTSKVYVLDLAGASHWKECASMERGRQEFGCGVIDGNIYVSGGSHDYRPVRGAEMYNPKMNAWSPIMPMTSLRANHRTCTVAGKIVVHGGEYYGEDYTGWRATEGRYYVADPTFPDFRRDALFWEIYDPGKDKWTVFKPFSEDSDYFKSWETMFMVDGKFYVMNEECIYVHDSGSWKLLKANSFPPIGPIACVEEDVGVEPLATVVLNDELIAGVNWKTNWAANWTDGPINRGSALLQSDGFDTENSKIDWKVVSRCAGTFDFMHCIQL